VLTNTFNPTASAYKNLDYVEKTAAGACGKAERAFGREDPIHIEALINLALFYWRRRREPAKAEPSLALAAQILSAPDGKNDELLAELIAAGVLVQALRDRVDDRLQVIDRVVNTVPRAFGVGSDLPQHIRAVEIYRRMAAVAIGSDHPVFPYLVSEVGRPLAWDLATAGHRAEAFVVLEQILPPLNLKVWKPDSYQVRTAEHEARWLRSEGADDVALRHDLERLAYDLGVVTRSAASNTLTAPGLVATREALQKALGHADQIIQAPVLQRVTHIDPAIEAFAAVLRAVEPPARDGCVLDKAEGANDRQRTMLLAQALTALACLHMARPGPEKAQDLERALDYLRRALSALYACLLSGSVSGPDDETVKDRTRVLLADVFLRRLHGDPEENVNEILVHTDSLELTKETDPYYWALGKYLRAIAYQQRQETKVAAGAKSDKFMPMLDVMAAVDFLKGSLDVFTKEAYPFEWAAAVLGWSAAIGPAVTADAPLDFKLQFATQLAASEEVFTPLTYPANWAAIQIHRARLAQALQGDDVEGFRSSPVEVLFRAQVFLSRLDHTELWSRLEQEKARNLAASAESAVRGYAAKCYANCLAVFSGPDSRERLTALSELGSLLFADGRPAEAIAPLEEAVAIGGRLFERSGSMPARRVAVSVTEGLSRRLAYCCFETDRLDTAVTALDRGKGRLLYDSLRLRLTDVSSVDAGRRTQAAALVETIRQLESSGYGGMGFIEDEQRLIEARRALQEVLANDRRGGDGGLGALSGVPPDAAIVMPLFSQRGGVAFLVTSGLTAMTARHVVPLPSLTSEAVGRWLLGQDEGGWFSAFAGREKDDEGAKRFEDVIERMCATLWDAFWKDVCARLREFKVREIVFVPSGGFQFLPVAAAGFSRGDGTDWRVVDEFRVRTVPSAGVLRLLEAEPQPCEARDRAVVAGVTKYEHLAHLPLVAEEVQAVAAAFGVEPLLDAAAAPAVLAGRVAGASFVHLACHGAPWAEDPNFRRSFSPRPVLNLGASGVSFRDILVGWDLRQTNLVVLSGCDTGLVEFGQPWDEFEGLSHVLLQAGARRVVGSLWSVDDESTALLMARFYHNLVTSRRDTADALAEAQRWLRAGTNASLAADYPKLYRPDKLDLETSPDARPFAHPYYWAPFFITG
jgi:CHAT domain-containing protein/tetratricopeptide (TPR) repeat protein